MQYLHCGIVAVVGNIGGRNMNEPLQKIDYENDPVFHRLQYEIRSAFEEGWRAAGGNPIRSPSEKSPVGWRLAWIGSKARAFLVANGIITGKVTWK